jgi:hypothetical protein
MRRSTTSLTLLLVGLLGCQTSERESGSPDCSDDRCNSAGSRDELLAAIDGFNDPIAQLLRASATERGTLAGNYRDVLDGVGTELGCDATTERSFVVLSNDGFVPKPIVTRCGGDAVTASQFFVAMVGTEDGFDPRTVHMTAWDAEAGLYRRYATAPTPAGDEMAINVAPGFCLGCHGGPEKLDLWVPLMNEMSSPWAGWNAQPGFASQLFDEHLDPRFASDETYREVTREGVLDSAASFEPIVRNGVTRVTGARLKQRAAAPDATLALELVRPLFCDESVNYVSEVHQSGELRSHAIIDDAFRSLYRSIAVDGTWTWLRDPRINLIAPTATESPVTLIPVRGESTLQVELGLVSRGALDPLDALRVRALDWKHPVQSSFRCNLFRQAADRITAGALDKAIAASGALTAEDLLPLVFDEIMTVTVGSTRVPLAPAADFELLQIPDATDPAALAALGSGDWTLFQSTLVQLGNAIETHITSFQAGRAALSTERDRRACLAVLQHPTAPIYPGIECP